MKKIIVVLFIITFFVSCNTLDKLTQFDINVSENVIIKPTLPINVPFDIPTPPIKLNTEQSFENNNTHKDLIQEISVSKLTMSVQLPEGEDFSILKSIDIYIETDDETDEKIAWLQPVPSVSVIDLEISNSDLKKIIMKDKITLKVKTITDEINTREYKIKIDAQFRVNARILGI